MAYTYDDFVNAANKSGLMGSFTQEELETAKKSPEFGLSVLSLRQDGQKATTAEQKLLIGEAEKQLMSTYGLSTVAPAGGSYGGQIANIADQMNNYGSFNYGNQDLYQKTLEGVANYGPFSFTNQGDYDKLLGEVTSLQPFSYDLQSDPQWAAYKKAALREGERATANTLAQVSAASGGRPSSYAVTAAQQAGNYYNSQLTDMIPTLYQNAYQQYLGDFNNKLSALGVLENARTFEYQDYLDTYTRLGNILGALKDDYSTKYSAYLDEYDMLGNNLEIYRGLQDTEYSKALDAIALADQTKQDVVTQGQEKYDNALQLFKVLGYATPEIAQVLGIPEGTVLPGAGDTSGDGTGLETGDTGVVIPDNVLASLKNSYPDGTVTSKTDWENFKALYGEDALTAAGFSYKEQGQKPETQEYRIDNTNGDGWIQVPGLGKLSYTELQTKVEKGEVREIIDERHGTVRYQMVQNPTGQRETPKNMGGGQLMLRQ